MPEMFVPVAVTTTVSTASDWANADVLKAQQPKVSAKIETDDV
jgi:hypothetical protein